MALSVIIELISSSARVTSVKSQQGGSLTQLERPGPILWTPSIPGSDKKLSRRCLKIEAATKSKRRKKIKKGSLEKEGLEGAGVLT